MVELIGWDPPDGGLPINEFLFLHFDGEANGGQPCALAVARLQHEDLAILNGELEVLHVLKVFLQGLSDFLQLAVGLWKVILELGDWFGCAHTGHHILSLSINEEFAVKNSFSGRGITRECDT